MRRTRKYIPFSERLAAALSQLMPQQQRDELRARKASCWEVIRQFTPDHNVLHALDGPDSWWNLTMRQRGAALKAKDAADTRTVAKVKRLNGETRRRPKVEIPSRPFPKTQRKMHSRGFR